VPLYRIAKSPCFPSPSVLPLWQWIGLMFWMMVMRSSSQMSLHTLHPSGNLVEVAARHFLAEAEPCEDCEPVDLRFDPALPAPGIAQGDDIICIPIGCIPVMPAIGPGIPPPICAGDIMPGICIPVPPPTPAVPWEGIPGMVPGGHTNIGDGNLAPGTPPDRLLGIRSTKRKNKNIWLDDILLEFADPLNPRVRELLCSSWVGIAAYLQENSHEAHVYPRLGADRCGQRPATTFPLSPRPLPSSCATPQAARHNFDLSVPTTQLWAGVVAALAGRLKSGESSIWRNRISCEVYRSVR
jgi:hypothetical protein